MMNKKNLPHIITAVSFVVFIVLGLACASSPKVGGDSQVNFSTNGGVGDVPKSQRVKVGENFTVPGGAGLSFGDAAFAGWYSLSSDGTITNYIVGESIPLPGGNITLFAKYKLDAVDLNSATGLANKLVWLQNNAESGGSYILEINTDENINTQRFYYPGKENITITLKGIGTNRTIRNTSKNDMAFVIFSGVSLVLDGNITIESSPPYGPIISVSGGNLTMNSRSTITGSGADTGVTVSSGTLIMNNGATITGIRGNIVTKVSGNRRDSQRTRGNGVQLSGGTFTMNEGAVISNCNEQGVVLGRFAGDKPSTFIMHGGTINGNGGSVTEERGVIPPEISGGGVAVYNGTFTMDGGSITNNAVAGNGGGVIVGSGGGIIAGITGATAVFTMTGGEITRNTAKIYTDTASGERVGGNAGGLFVSPDATFNMSGGSITNNTSQAGGPNNAVFAEKVDSNGRVITRAKANITGGNLQKN